MTWGDPILREVAPLAKAGMLALSLVGRLLRSPAAALAGGFTKAETGKRDSQNNANIIYY